MSTSVTTQHLFWSCSSLHLATFIYCHSTLPHLCTSAPRAPVHLCTPAPPHPCTSSPRQVSTGTEQLRQAADYQSKARRKKIILAVVGLVILGQIPRDAICLKFVLKQLFNRRKEKKKNQGHYVRLISYHLFCSYTGGGDCESSEQLVTEACGPS